MKNLKLLFAAFLLLLLACQEKQDYETSSQSINSVITGKTITPDDAATIAQKFRDDITQAYPTRSTQLSKPVATVYAWLSSDIYHHSPTRSTVSEFLPDTLLYIVNYADNDGYALVSANTRIPGVVAYIEEGSLTPRQEIDNPGFQLFLEGYKEYYENTRDYIIPDDDIHNLWGIYLHLPPLLTTKWGQGAPYNKYCFTPDNQQAVAGCVAIATAQIAAYHQTPDSYNGHVYDWDAIMQYEQVPVTDTIAANSVGHLVHDIGVLVGMNYGVSSSGAYSANVSSCWNAFGYNYIYDTSTAVFDSIKVEISNNRPVYMKGNKPTGGHAWVVDGILIKYANEVDEFFQPIEVYQNLIHCNWGWNGYGNGYFIIGAFQNKYSPYEDNPTSFPSGAYNSNNYTYRHVYPNPLE